MKRTLSDFRSNIYSQNGEDGVLAELCRRLDIRTGWFCEFGAWDGKYGSNTFALLKNGWQGLMIEGDPDRFKALERNSLRFHGRLLIRQMYVDHHRSERSLDSILRGTPIPADFDVLAIDIDGYDYQVWESLRDYRPKIVIIEICSRYSPGEFSVFDESGRLTSFSAMVDLGHRKDYVPVCHTGNLFFVAKEYVSAVGLAPDFLSDPNRFFIDDWVRPTRYQTFLRKLRNLTWRRLLAKIENTF